MKVSYVLRIKAYQAHELRSTASNIKQRTMVAKEHCLDFRFVRRMNCRDLRSEAFFEMPNFLYHGIELRLVRCDRLSQSFGGIRKYRVEVACLMIKAHVHVSTTSQWWKTNPWAYVEGIVVNVFTRNQFVGRKQLASEKISLVKLQTRITICIHVYAILYAYLMVPLRY